MHTHIGTAVLAAVLTLSLPPVSGAAPPAALQVAQLPPTFENRKDAYLEQVDSVILRLDSQMRRYASRETGDPLARQSFQRARRNYLEAREELRAKADRARATAGGSKAMKAELDAAMAKFEAAFQAAESAWK